jgi:hypothetical protein
LHLGRRDAPLESRECREHGRRAFLQVEPVQEHGPVLREVPQIVLEDSQAVVRDLRVGGIEVDDVDVPRRESAVGQVVIERSHVLLRQRVAFAEHRPAVAPVEELLAEGSFRLGRRRRSEMRITPSRAASSSFIPRA